MEFNNSDSLDYLLVKVIRLHHYRTQMLLEDLGLYPGQPPILFILGKEDGRSQKELAEKLRLKPATITVMLGRMERAGLLERRTDPKDLRVSRVFLTEKGRNIRQQALERKKIIEKECFEGFTGEEKILLRRFMLHMHENLSKACKE